MNKLLVLAVCSWFAFAAASHAEAAEITIKAGHGNITGSIQDMGLQKLRDLLEEKTDGKATIEIFSNAVLGHEPQLVEGLLLGTVDMAMTSNAILSNHVNDLRVLDMPFLFENVNTLGDALDGEASALMADAAIASGFRIIGVYSSGTRHLMTKKEVSSIADLENMKIRTMQQPMHIKTFRAFGANPTALGYSELYSALQTGVVDGAEAATSDYSAQRFYEVADHFALLGWLHLTAHIVMSEAKFSSLPEDVQAALLEAGRESAVWQRQYAADQEKPLLDELRAKNVSIVELDGAPFREAAKPLYDEFIETDSQRALFEALTR